MPLIDLNKKAKPSGSRTIKEELEAQALSTDNLPRLQTNIQQYYGCSSQRALSLSLLENYIQLKRAESTRKSEHFPDDKTLIAYRIRNALLDKANVGKKASDIISRYAPDMLKIKGWGTHRLYTVLELISAEEGFQVMDTQEQTALGQFSVYVLPGDSFLDLMASNAAASPPVDGYQYRGLSKLSESDVESLTTHLGKERAQCVVGLLSYIYGRWQKHLSSQRRFCGRLFGAELNREGQMSLYYASDLLFRLLLQPKLSIKEVIEQVIDPKDNVFSLAGMSRFHALKKFVDQSRSSLVSLPDEFNENDYYQFVHGLMTADSSSLPCGDAIRGFVQSKYQVSAAASATT